MKKLTIICALWTMFLALSLNAEKLEIVNGGFKVGEFSMPAFDGEKKFAAFADKTDRRRRRVQGVKICSIAKNRQKEKRFI